MVRRTIEPLWTVEEVSAYLGVPVATLYQWRHRRVGPLASRVGRHLRYDPADVRAWLIERQAA
ncbi:DNA binding domain-containing protein, excisionase family [Micromonospora echinofusca]|uniref:DNA binding domain-containing protein, excisionase family n=1 Tax=Micromonospora echinofusca TaxID=47858 RepID=A0A1C5G2E6_MICEH|nr:helix-turn-helix domain-containing protein [Micromonospora echinofusca]SCG14009.1 DNA binding domain-containing protein, excisionase family [Micromonospora echinofusca]